MWRVLVRSEMRECPFGSRLLSKFDRRDTPERSAEKMLSHVALGSRDGQGFELIQNGVAHPRSL
jgi:hypothetical protein